MKKAKIALLGLGTVGSGVFKIISTTGADIRHRDNIDIEIKKILVRDKNKKRAVECDESLITDNFEDILNDPEIELVAEFMGGVTPAKDYMIKALEAGKTVVTANKECLAKHWPELNAAALKSGAGLYFEASVAGGIPIIRTIWDSMQANNIQSVMGIINGTTNYMLSTMEEKGVEYAEVLKDAQQKGYAEADPKNDVEGYDAAFKLSILSSLAFHARIPVDYIYKEGITKITKEDILYANELGYTIKLLAIGKKHDKTIEVRVHPTMIPKTHPLSSVRGAFNAVFIEGSAVGDIMLYGKGAGDLPTGSAVVSDIVIALTTAKHKYTTFRNEYDVSKELTFNFNWLSKFYVRMESLDKPGVLAKVAGIFASHDVSVATVLQKGSDGERVPLIFVTHEAREVSFMNAIEEISKLDEITAVHSTIRVEG